MERVRKAQRAEVIDLLNRALDDGRLPLDEYDRRIAAVGTATYGLELYSQLRDLPEGNSWHPHPAAPPAVPRPGERYEATAVILGLLSLPLSVCLIGWIFGILAILYSRRGSRAKGLSAALIGRVLGIVGIVLSIGAGIAVLVAVGGGGP
jgi:hypothetical protein